MIVATIRKSCCIFALLILFSACDTNYSYNEPELKNQALTITEQLDEQTLNDFRIWGVVPRGTYEFWHTNYDSTFNVTFYPEYDTSLFVVGLVKNFVKHFPVNFKADIAQYDFWTFKKSTNSFTITSGNSVGGFKKVIAADKLFLRGNPFEKVKTISKRKNQLGIIKIDNFKPINILDFYVSPQHVLTYVPDSLFIDSGSRKFWVIEVDKIRRGMRLKKNWYYRKLSKPEDLGR